MADKKETKSKKKAKEVLHRLRSNSILENTSPGMRTAPSTYSMTEEGEERYQKVRYEKSFSRTTLVLLDYVQFKAARKIQALVRGWLLRRRLAKRNCAAIIIQRDWRRYSAMQNYYRILERTVQERIDKHHNDSAIKIQALWRGFWVREHIHNQFRLKRSQRMAAEDLLHCIAYKLHYLLRTYSIPGVYSLRNSKALSKIEKLLVSISYKQGNKRAFVSRLKREADLKRPKDYFQKMAHATRLPYAGPNFSGYCDPTCCDIFKEPDIDARMHQVLRMYESEQYKQLQKCQAKPKKSPKFKIPKDPQDFCTDVIRSMRRWNILVPDKFAVRPDLFKDPDNVAAFLKEIESLYDFMRGNCACKVNVTNFPPLCEKKV